MKREEISGQWRKLLAAVEGSGGTAGKLLVSPPATEAEVVRVEKSLRLTLPPMFRDCLRTFARGMNLEWSLPALTQLPKAVESVKWGGIRFSLDGIVESERTRQYCLKYAVATWGIPSITETWENKISFFTTANGDFLAVDVSAPGREPVIYLSHDGDGNCHGYLLGTDFVDFLVRWTGVGCPGPEWWVMEPFTHGFTKPLDPKCTNAVLWRKAVGFEA